MTLLVPRASINCHLVRHLVSQSLFWCLGNKTQRVQHEVKVINQMAVATSPKPTLVDPHLLSPSDT